MPRTDRIRGLSRWPIVVAPMAGGPTVPALAIAAAHAGALPFLAGGYKSAEGLRDEMEAVRAGTDGAFGVNLFVPGTPAKDPASLRDYVAGLAGEAAALGAELAPAAWDDDGFGAKIELLLGHPPALVSFTFGCPPTDVVRAFQAASTPVVITVTSPDEAALAERAGVDGLCLQGMEAGAHRGTFDNDDASDPELPLFDLLTEVRRQTDLPLIGAGGIAGPDNVAAVLAAGAAAVQAGTAFLRCPESGTSPAHGQALADPRFTATALTRAFSGRRARSLVNRFVREHEGAPAAYPEVNNATRPLRSAAAAAGDSDHMSLYAGVRFREAAARPAAEIVARLATGVPGRAA